MSITTIWPWTLIGHATIFPDKFFNKIKVIISGKQKRPSEPRFRDSRKLNTETHKIGIIDFVKIGSF